MGLEHLELGPYDVLSKRRHSMGEPSIHMTMALSSPLVPAFQAGLFTAAVYWMFDAAIAITPGGETSQTDHIYSPPQTWGINAEIISAEVYPD